MVIHCGMKYDMTIKTLIRYSFLFSFTVWLIAQTSHHCGTSLGSPQSCVMRLLQFEVCTYKSLKLLRNCPKIYICRIKRSHWHCGSSSSWLTVGSLNLYQHLWNWLVGFSFKVDSQWCWQNIVILGKGVNSYTLTWEKL